MKRTDDLEFALVWGRVSVVEGNREVQVTFFHLDVIWNKAHFVLHLKARMAGLLKDQAS